jgi:hypothetical protein
MSFARCAFAVCLGSLLVSSSLSAQQSNSSVSAGSVPRLVNFSGNATDAQGKSVSGTAGVTFAIYKDQSGGGPLWLETQTVRADSKGNYTVQLGATQPEGIPLDLFSSGEARWLGVRVNGAEEQPRVLLLSVPYALKAADAQTLGGLPASAFMLAGVVPVVAAPSNVAVGDAGSLPPPASSDVTTTGGTVNTIPLFTTGTNIQSSILSQTGSGSTRKIGINTANPASILDVAGATTVRGILSLPPTGSATTTAGKNSQTLKLTASSYNSGTGAAVNQNFLWQAEPLGNDTASAGGTLNLLHAIGANAPAETGLKIAGTGRITFAAGQTFPGTGTVSSVGLSAPASDFTVSGSPVKGSGALTLNWTVAPSSSNVANAIVKRDSNGNFAATTIIASDVVSSANGGSAVSGSTTSGSALYGSSTGTGTGNNGVYGITTATAGSGVVGINNNGGLGVYGSGNTGVYGTGTYGVYGSSSSNNAAGVRGDTGATQGAGVWAYSSTVSDALFAENQGGGLAGEFSGDLNVEGNLSKSGGSFKIDHPLDPANKYLYHSFVESPDMKNIYDGKVTTDAQGNAVVTLPEWFEALNRDFRYQLTVIGQFAQAIVSAEVSNHQFSIKTDKPNVKVSWQVTGIRQDAWANAHRIPVEQPKATRDRGLYLHPELFGAPHNKSIVAAHHPGEQKISQTVQQPTQGAISK